MPQTDSQEFSTQKKTLGREVSPKLFSLVGQNKAYAPSVLQTPTDMVTETKHWIYSVTQTKVWLLF